MRKCEVLVPLRHPNVLAKLLVMVFVFFVNFRVYEIFREFPELLYLTLADRLGHLPIHFETVSQELSPVQHVLRPRLPDREEQSEPQNTENTELNIVGRGDCRRCFTRRLRAASFGKGLNRYRE